MSGVEAAGLVLAVFPIVVSGLKHFTEGVETVKSWKRYQRVLARYSRILETQQIVYLNTIEGLFEGIIQSNDELDALMKEPGAAFSHQPEYEERLRARLGRSYGNYDRITADMLDALEAARKELGIDENGKVRSFHLFVVSLFTFGSVKFPHSCHALANALTLPSQILWNDYSSFKRLKLTLKENVYTDLISEIKEANKELKEFTKESYFLESNRNKRRPKRQPVDFKLIRRQARSLYNVMVRGRSWRCKCLKYHMASLRLEPRPWEEDNGKGVAVEAPRLKFRVLLSRSCPDDGLEVTWKWQELEIEPVDTSESPMAGFENDAQTLSIATLSLASSYVSSLHISRPVQADSRVRSKPLAKKKAVNFAVFSPTKPTWPSAAIEPPQTGMGPIHDICTTVHEYRGVRQSIGFLTDESVGQHRHNVYSVDEKLRQGVDPKSLEYLLQVSKQRGQAFSLSRRERLYIAVTLASSVLQLDGTLWLKSQWRSGDILFLPLEDRNVSTPRVDFAHPYVSWKVSPQDANIALDADADRTTIAHRIPSEILFVLGITLTELCFGQNIYDMRVQDDNDTTEIMTNFNTASRLIDYVYGESGNRYGDVVRRCLKCPPDVRDASLDNEEFQEAVFESIVTPLRQDFEDFNGGSRIR